MLTRCPACDTTFRITPELLKVRQGKVRCGECQHVFNALDTLIDETVVASVPAPPVPVKAVSAITEPDEEIFGAVPPAPTFDSEPEETLAPPATDAPVVLPEPESVPDSDQGPVFEPPPESVVGFSTTGDTSPPDPLLHEPLGNGAGTRPWSWVVGTLLGLLVLALQVVIYFRVELAVVVPEARPLLESICSMSACTVDLPSKAELMTIETSDLQPDAEQKGLLKLSATLRNRAPFTQAYPHLELSLTDTENKALARRVLRPEDYLAKSTAVAGGLASGEFTVSVGIDSGNVGASGYRLYLFYP